LTVASLMNNLAAASRLVVPAATSSRTSSSRWLSGPAPAGARNRLISRAATEGEHRLAPGRGPDRPQQFGARRILEQIAGRARLDRGQHMTVGVVGGQHQHTRGAASLS
jgi:hypothetical protein